MKQLFRVPVMSADQLLTAPDQDVQDEFKRLCSKLCLATTGKCFKDTLQGSQKHWLSDYRKIPKVANAGEVTLVNLCQNPHKVPVAGVYCPALLRGSRMWLLCPPAQNETEQKAADLLERPLLPEEHLQIMGVPMYANFASDMVFPFINIKLTSTAMRSLAGNVPCLTHAITMRIM